MSWDGWLDRQEARERQRYVVRGRQRYRQPTVAPLKAPKCACDRPNRLPDETCLKCGKRLY